MTIKRASIYQSEMRTKFNDTYLNVGKGRGIRKANIFTLALIFSNIIFLLTAWEFHTMITLTSLSSQVYPSTLRPPPPKKYTKYNLCCPYTH